MSLTNAKNGSVLFVEAQQDSFYLATVDRTTKSRVYCGASAFDRQGRPYPRRKWNYAHARIATVDDVAKVEEATRRRQCINVILAKASNINDLHKFSTEKLGHLAAILEKE